MGALKTALRPRVLEGSGSELRKYFQTTDVLGVAVVFQNKEQSVLFAPVIRKIGELLPEIVESRTQQKVNSLIEAFLPDVTLSESAIIEAQMVAEAKAEVLRSGSFVAATKIAKLAGYSSKNPSAQPHKWKKDGAIFAIHHKGTDYYPLYALNPDDNYRPYAALAEIIRIFGEKKTGWGLSYWFEAINSFLDDQKPKDLLATDPKDVIAAARDEVEDFPNG
ncbi:MAG: hypothetical protein BGO25_10400 [Acidobacteriales bacterium 59-55]|nr:hypothetical protein [Terriglobales bacterium]OJV43594.1 MAG: hypothetical protein BGO25_10400 [Acidobacteriales bacterium 59-55]